MSAIDLNSPDSWHSTATSSIPILEPCEKHLLFNTRPTIDLLSIDRINH